MWERSVRAAVDSMSRPLTTSGWHVSVLSCDQTANRVAVSLTPGTDCDACVMSDEDFAGLLQAALRREHEGIDVSVNA